jgi:hypothetical protein
VRDRQRAAKPIDRATEPIDHSSQPPGTRPDRHLTRRQVGAHAKADALRIGKRKTQRNAAVERRYLGLDLAPGDPDTAADMSRANQPFDLDQRTTYRDHPPETGIRR